LVASFEIIIAVGKDGYLIDARTERMLRFFQILSELSEPLRSSLKSIIIPNRRRFSACPIVREIQVQIYAQRLAFVE